MIKIGVTETYDPCFDYSWVDNLKDANIIITKNLTDRMIEELVKHKNKCILHFTVTGWGGTEIEPNAPTWQQSYVQFRKLIDLGFPIEQFVLRVDPIIPNNYGLHLLSEILNTFICIGKIRCRISILDLYRHVKDRFQDLSKRTNWDPIYKLPWWSWNIPDPIARKVLDVLKIYAHNYDFSACAEPIFKVIDPSQDIIKQIGCVSQTDLDLLGIHEQVEGKSSQRPTCLCCANKIQIIKRKPGRCPHGCIYCYWKD